MTVEARSIRTESTSEVEILYEESLPLLIGIAVGQFSIQNIDAETLAHEVFLSYLLKSEEIHDPRAFLVSAIHNASKHYLRQRARQGPLPDDESQHPRITRIGEIVSAHIAVSEAFGCITPRCQLALRLRYLEGFSVFEVANELRITASYARNLIARCLKQVRRRYLQERQS